VAMMSDRCGQARNTDKNLDSQNRSSPGTIAE